MDLLQRVQNLIDENGLLKRGDGVIVGCSGGPDSMCLLDLLLRLRGPMDLTLKVVHIEHGFRGQASEADAQFVEAFCKERNVDCVVYREDVRALAAEEGISEETAGRNVRYGRFFEERARLEERLDSRGDGAWTEGNATGGKALNRVKIAVAHNRNDQAETVLMRIMRGTGLEGLKGMELQREDGVVRPLLTTDRSEIEAYCEAKGLEPRHDHTNGETDHARNKVRLELLPYIKENFNENIEEALLRLSQIAAESQAVIQQQAELEKDRCKEDRAALCQLSDGLRHAVIVQIIKDMGLTANLAAVHLHQIDRLLKSGAASGEVQLPGGYRVEVSYGRVIWMRPVPESGVAETDRAMAGRGRKTENGATERRCGDTEVGAPGYIMTREEPRNGRTPEELRSLPQNVKCFDAEKVRKALGQNRTGDDVAVLALRTRRPGDFIRPLGSPGRKKLQDWFVDRKIPKQERDRIALVCIGSEVLWVTGHQISENFKVETNTEQLIFVEFHQ